MKIYFGSDHAGLELKNKLIEYIKQQGYEVIDLGTYTKDSCDYPDYANSVVIKVKSDTNAYGVLICGSGIGMSIAANRYIGIRAALCHNTLEAKLARAHNNANILVLGGRLIGEEMAKEILKTFLETNFEGGRHIKRIEKLDLINNKI